MLSIKFQDGELIQGKGWGDLPNKPIKRITVQIKDKKIILENFEAYNHLIEKCLLIIGNQTFIRSRYFMGRIGNNVKVIHYNFLTDECREYTAPYGQEYQGRASTGWKLGIFDSTSNSQII